MKISNTAGTYVCNTVFYSLLHWIKMKHLKTVAGFVHLPYLPCQITEKTGAVAVDLSLQVSVMNAFMECLVGK